MKHKSHVFVGLICGLYVFHLYNMGKPFLVVSLLFLALLYYDRRLFLKEALIGALLLLIVLIRFDALNQTEERVQMVVNQPFTVEIVEVLHHRHDYQQVVAKRSGTNEKVMISYFDTITTPLYPGLLYTVVGEVEAIEKATNPGQFDYHDYLKTKQIRTLIQAERFAYDRAQFYHVPFKWRAQLMERMSERLSDTANKWVQALVLGEKSDLKEEAQALFSRWHISHLLAISGFHLSLIIIGLSFLLSRLLGITKETISIVLVVTFIVFPFIAGGSPSIVRASLVGGLSALALIIKTRFDAIDVLSLVFIFLVVIQPSWLQQLGFQFSFLVTFAILLSRPILIRLQDNYKQVLFIGLLAFLMTLPLQIFHFYLINPLSLLLNPLVSVFFSLLFLPVIFITFVVAHVFPIGLYLLDPLIIVLDAVLMKGISVVDQNLYYPLVLGEIPMYIILLLGLVTFFLMVEIERWRSRKIGWWLVLLITVLVIVKIRPYLNPFGQVTMLDFTQANVLVIERPYREGVILYDVGGTMLNDYQTPSDELYQTRLKPFLINRGITEIDAVILSHGHHDHIGSLAFLSQDFKIDQLITSNHFDATLLNGINIPHIQVDQGKRFEIRGQIFEVLSSTSDSADENNQSLVLKTTIGPKDWLLTGDITEKIELEMIVRHPELNIDILMVPHHGSRTSSSLQFLRQITPSVAFISVGKDNRFNHPHPKVVERFLHEGIDLYRTDHNGAVTYRYHIKEPEGSIEVFSSK